MVAVGGETSAVEPEESSRVPSAPLSSRAFTMAVQPCLAARCSGVSLHLLTALTSAWCEMSCRTLVKLQSMQARCSGVQPTLLSAALGSALAELGHCVFVAVFARYVQRRPSVLPLGVHAAALALQLEHRGRVATGGRQVHGGPTLRGPRVGVGPVGQQMPADALVGLLGGHVERRAAIAVHAVHQRPALQQLPHHPVVALLGRQVQGGGEGAVGGVGVGALAEQQLGDAQVSVVAGQEAKEKQSPECTCKIWPFVEVLVPAMLHDVNHDWLHFRKALSLRNFKKNDFGADWIKVAERRFSKVYRVKLKLWREQCALKSFDTSLSANNFYRRMTEEASEIAKVKIKYIVSIYGLCSDPTAVVMEYMSNGSLDNLLASHTLMWPKKFQMIHEVTMGMNFLHSMSPPMLHLNLKTSNLLLDDHLHVKISDFGLIKWEDGLNKKTFLEHLTARGNISYIPPETFNRSPEAPVAAFDVYSFAIVMWEILTQQRPNPGRSVTTVLVQVSEGKRPGVDQVPDDKPPECSQMIDIMEHCWDQDLHKRPDFAVHQPLHLPTHPNTPPTTQPPNHPAPTLLCRSQPGERRGEAAWRLNASAGFIEASEPPTRSPASYQESHGAHAEWAFPPQRLALALTCPFKSRS
ncbi:LOW QUALITY PROTEIN: hypothetical protein CRUP_028057 [Coryphaenoides rupestris]|nr:LOW QUALITY PROTEIN: hypothetical protein CRUP_028057 [Coryphaenoides rupestris]